jgi:hypothetical protein
MLRDNLVGLIEPMLNGAGDYPLALHSNRKQSSDDRPPCLENPRPAGAESTLTENVASPFHAEPGHYSLRHTYTCLRLMEGADIYQIAKKLPHQRRDDREVLRVTHGHGTHVASIAAGRALACACAD